MATIREITARSLVHVSVTQCYFVPFFIRVLAWDVFFVRTSSGSLHLMLDGEITLIK